MYYVIQITFIYFQESKLKHTRFKNYTINFSIFCSSERNIFIEYIKTMDNTWFFLTVISCVGLCLRFGNSNKNALINTLLH